MEEENKVDSAAEQEKQNLPCGRAVDACIYKAIENMIEGMKKEVAEKQNIQYPEQLTVAEIYFVVASTLAEACRKKFSVQLKNCVEAEKHKKVEVNMDVFILLKQLKEDGLVAEDLYNDLFAVLVEMKPELKQQVEADQARGII